MKSRFSITFAAVLLLAGCANRYDVIKSNGDRLTARSKPKLVDDSYWLFVDMTGRTNKIPSFQVRTVQPQDLWGTDSKSSFYINK